MKFIISAAIVLLSFFEVCQAQFNRRPTIDRIPDYGPILENSGEQTVEMTGISTGLWEYNQTVTITAWSENLSLINVVHVDYENPSRTGKLRFTPLPDANGKAKIVVRVDDGMPSRNITETSFTVTVTPVNGAPTFKLSTQTVSVKESSGKTSIPNFAINIDDGDPELNQKLSFILDIETVSGNIAFKNDPEIKANNGELNFELQPATSGEALISVILKDNGDTSNGGINESDPQDFKIIVEKTFNPPTLNELKPLTILEDSGEQSVELTGISSGGNDSQTLTIKAVTSNPALITGIKINYVQGSSTGTILFSLASNKFGFAVITVTVDNGSPENNLVSRDMLVTVDPVADTPSVTNATTTRDQQTQSGLVISRNPVDGAEVSHFTITAITNGTLYQNNGTTPITNNSFITFAQGNAGLKFTPVLDGSGNGSFKIQAATGPQNNKSGGNVITAIITIENKAPALDELKPLTIPEDSGEQSVELSGISPGGNNDQTLTIKAVTSNPALITGIKINYVQGGSAGVLLFSPASDKFGSAVITVTVDNGLPENNLVSRDMLVTVEPVADTPSVTNATTTRDQQTKSGLVISRNPVDGAEVTHFKITAITSGTLYQNNGTTPITNNSFITFAQGNAGLKFTPVLGGSGNGSFKIQAATGTQNNKLGGNVITAVITIENDAPVITSVPDTIVEIRVAYLYTITATDSNPGDVLSITVLLPPAVQTWLKFTNQSNGTGVLSGTPPTGTIGQYSIYIKVSDQNGAYVEQAYTLWVIPPNQKPVLSALSMNIDEDDTLFFSKIDFVSRFSDPDGDTLAFWKVVNDPVNGSLFMDGNLLSSGAEITANQMNKLIYIPDKDYYGFDLFDWNASDGRDYALVNQRVNIMIAAVNDPPELVNLEKIPVIYEFGELSVSITDSATVVDVDNDRLQKMTLRFTGGYYTDEDSIYLPPTNSLAYVWEKDKGMMTITGYLSTSIYEAALRSAKYINVRNLAPKIDKRQIEIVLYDLDTSSIPYIREIEFENSFVDLDIPSGFTPNHDGVNDTWNIGNLERYDDILLAVYSRTGKKIFETRRPTKEWDGTYNGSEVPTGVYYYYISIQKFEKVYKGTVSVLK